MACSNNLMAQPINEKALTATAIALSGAMKMIIFANVYDDDAKDVNDFINVIMT